MFEINPPRWVARMFGGGAARRDSSNLLSSATSGVEEAAAVAAREIAAGTSSRGESMFSVADISDAEAYRPGHPHRATRRRRRRRTGRGASRSTRGGRSRRARTRARSRRRRRRTSGRVRGAAAARRGGGRGRGRSRRGRRSAPRWPARGGRCPRIDRRGSSSRRRGSCDVLSGAVVTLKRTETRRVPKFGRPPRLTIVNLEL